MGQNKIGIVGGGASLKKVAGVQVDEVAPKGFVLRGYPGGGAGKATLHICAVYISGCGNSYPYALLIIHIDYKVKQKNV